MRSLRIILSITGCLFILSASTCYYDDVVYPEKAWGLKPVYSNNIEDLVEMLPPRPLNSPGKIYTYGNKLLISERHKGVHVFDNTDPSNPENLMFLSIVGNVDVAIRNGVLYADQANNLVSININSIGSDSLIVAKTDDVISPGSLGILEPPGTDVYYECPDFTMGTVVSWEQDTVEYPCYKYE